MKRMKVVWICVAGTIILTALFFAILNSIIDQQSGADDEGKKSEQYKPAQAAVIKKNKPIDNEVVHKATLAAVGDVLIHERVYKPAKTEEGYDFKPNLATVRPLIQNADIAVANSESIIGGADIGVSTYPSFNSPYEVGDALKYSGFDLVTMANNHTLDRGIPAITHAIHYWDKIGMVHTGSALSTKGQNKIATVTKNHIIFSFLAYTYGTNGVPTPDGKDYLVNRINLPKMKQDIQQAKKVSDVVVVALHFGKEYERMPNSEQKKLVQQLSDLGVDIILGSHPHVLQPVEWLSGKNGNKTFVAYSLGNFFTGQDDGIYKEIGGILKLTVVEHVDGEKKKITLEDPRFQLTWVNPRDYKVVPLNEAEHYGLRKAKWYYDEMKKHMQQWMPQLNVS